MRLFVSVGWTESTIAYLEELQHKLKLAGVKGYWRRGENLHLTLKFLGEVEDSQVPKLTQALEASAIGIHPFELELKGIGVFPNVRSPRVLWVGANHAELVRLKNSMDAKLAQIGFEREHREFRAHITLATGKISGLKDSLKEELSHSVKAKELVKHFELMESVVIKGVRRYRCLGSFKLEG